MASGGFHDSSTHTGSFHSSGGGGGSHSSSGGGGYSSYDSGGGGGGGGGSVMWIWVVVYTAAYCAMYIDEMESLSVMHIVTLVMVIAVFFLFSNAMQERKRFAAIRRLRNKYSETDQLGVWSAEYSDNRNGSDETWYDHSSKKYSILFTEEEYGVENVKAVIKTVKRTPGIIWVSPAVWFVLSLICAISNIFFYELVIPFFERAYMTDEAFAFFDITVLLLPSVLALTFAVLNKVFVKTKDKILYECAVRIITDRRAKENKERTERGIDRKLSSKWYYNNCPNCGAKADYHLKTCQNCGSSLEAGTAAGGAAGAIHRLIKTEEGGEKS